MNNQNLQLINSLIKKTKTNAIHWKSLSSSDIEIKKEKSCNPNSTFQTSSVTALTNQTINPDASFFIHHKDGYIFLLSKNSFASIETIISLVVQTKLSNCSMEYASTLDKDNEIIASLKRLYNIVDSYDYDIASYVNDFIND